MNNEYDQPIAKHYAAYRPLLHRPILKKCLESREHYSLGLDIGCGTGQSAIALANYCKMVIGIDPSRDMLDKALQHPKIHYRIYNRADLEFEDNHFDTITFSGSLYYAKSQELLDEIVRVGKPNTKIIVYDFEIVLDDILHLLQIDVDGKTEQNYNHQENFSGLDEEHVQLLKTAMEETAIQLSSSNLSHLLLSSKENYSMLHEKFGQSNLHENLKENLEQISNTKQNQLMAKIYYSIYSCVK